MFRIQLAWASEEYILTNALRQFVPSILPRAIATIDGFHNKAHKCHIFQYEYINPDIQRFFNDFINEAP